MLLNFEFTWMMLSACWVYQNFQEMNIIPLQRWDAYHIRWLSQNIDEKFGLWIEICVQNNNCLSRKQQKQGMTRWACTCFVVAPDIRRSVVTMPGCNKRIISQKVCNCKQILKIINRWLELKTIYHQTKIVVTKYRIWTFKCWGILKLFK